MKVTIDIDCTPDEARRFLGLPDVAPMQAALLAEVQAQMEKSIRGLSICDRFTSASLPRCRSAS
jgi:hypothetical protein